MNECIITYDGVPTYTVSVMGFADEHVVHETQYFADSFGSPAWRWHSGADAGPDHHHDQVTELGLAIARHRSRRTAW